MDALTSLLRHFVLAHRPEKPCKIWSGMGARVEGAKRIINPEFLLKKGKTSAKLRARLKVPLLTSMCDGAIIHALRMRKRKTDQIIQEKILSSHHKCR
jgi:hypothetical protein